MKSRSVRTEKRERERERGREREEERKIVEETNESKMSINVLIVK